MQLSSFFNQVMFAVRFNDLNLLISSQITPDSRLMFDRGVQARVSKAAPFLSLDADPYPVLVNGQIDWVQDAYTTTDNYPYAQDADTGAVASGSGLNENVQLRPQLGEGGHQRLHGQDDLLRDGPERPDHPDLREGLPGHVHAGVEDAARAAAHIRYPEDIFTVQATMYGQYHITRAASFYSAADAWTLSPDPGAGSPSTGSATTQTVNAQGQVVSTGQLVRMSPIYQVMRVPGQTTQSFNLLDAFVPVSSASQIQNLSGFMIAGSDPGHYGQLKMFVTPRDNPVNGPALVAAKIDATARRLEPDLPPEPERIVGAAGQRAA